MAKSKRVGANELSPAVVERIRADIERQRPGLWAEENDYGPACCCGLRKSIRCYRHPEGSEDDADDAEGPPDTQPGSAR